MECMELDSHCAFTGGAATYYRSLNSRIMLQDEGVHPEAVTEWWYQNALFETSNTPVSDWSMISAFITDRPGVDRLLFLLFPPGREPIDLSCHLEEEKMQAAATGGDVRYGNNAFKGRYPEYELYLDGVDQQRGTHYLLELKYVAKCVPLHLSSEQTGIASGRARIQTWTGYGWGITGSITIDQERYPVRGAGYTEHIWGNPDPAVLKGWLWYSIPQADDKGLSINTAVFIHPDGSFIEPEFTFSLDGKSWGIFRGFDVEVLEKREIAEGMEHPTKLLYAGECDVGRFSMTLSRLPNEYLGRAMGPKRRLVITGPAFAEGFVEYQGEQRKIRGKSIGSTFLILGT